LKAANLIFNSANSILYIAQYAKLHYSRPICKGQFALCVDKVGQVLSGKAGQ